MQAKISADEQDSGGPAAAPPRTFTEAARRAQIVDAAIEVIADEGYAKATYARIARRAGLSSTGMISYHFAGKADLMREVVAEVMRVADGYMRPRIEAQPTAAGRLRAHIESNLELLGAHPKHLPALLQVLAQARGDEPWQQEFAAEMGGLVDRVAEALARAQEAGEFGDFDPWVMAMAIRGAVDAVVSRVAGGAAIDVAACGRELADLFDRATRKA
ncbi:TetR/AcrR family transcriptional regulator [Streptomyces mashuensis]|nr:TetR/AcrR family transcriptional regulator [Streptomyces mashuensis]